MKEKNAKPITHRCKQCRIKAECIRVGLHWFCTMYHAIQWALSNAQKHKDKKFRRQKREFYENDKDTQEKRAVTACHLYIRSRDASKPCVSCGRHHTGQYHAGHYRPSGVNSALRYDERNIYKQCAPCNNKKSGNLSAYRLELIRRIGIETVEWLDNNHEIKRWTIDELKEITAYYKEKLKQLPPIPG